MSVQAAGDAIRFTVFGDPQTAGSKKAFMLRRRDGSPVTRGNGSPIINITDDNSKSKGWKQQVAYAARQAYRGELLDGPVRLTLTFFRPRLGSHFGTGRNAGRLKDSAPEHPTTKPDVLKLARAVEDALTKVVWGDDAQIVDERLVKAWGEPARVEVTIEQL